MWCRSCQQDVPAVASNDDATVRCARCHSDLSASPSETGSGDNTESPATPSADSAIPTSTLDDTLTWSTDVALRNWESWELSEDLREADRLVKSLGIQRVDAAHEPPRDPLEAPAVTAAATQLAANKKKTKPRRGSFLTWIILSLGLMTFAFGAVLLGWSYWMQRPDLWRLGMPFTLAGQGALVVGLFLQLDGLWRSNQAAAESLDELDDQLDELRRATTLLSTSHSGPSQSFYSHMASGAGPHLLLADLKSQLDLLAVKLGDQQR